MTLIQIDKLLSLAKLKISESPQSKARAASKTLSLTLAEVREMIDSEGMIDELVTRNASIGTLRFVVRMKGSIPESWAMSLLLNNERVDGIDWEQRVIQPDGTRCSGWHRHFWTTDRGDRNKECIPGFKPGSAQEFLRAGMAIMKVKLKRGAHDDSRLLLD